MNNQLLQTSVIDYVDLSHRVWFVELESNDFGSSLASILDLPINIYEMNKSHFWAFLKIFIQRCEISFITIKSSNHSSINKALLALIGWWNDKQYAIPLWILRNRLFGFEIISSEYFCLLDSEPLTWLKPALINMKNNEFLGFEESLVLEEGLSYGRRIYFKIKDGNISVSDYYKELEFFETVSNIHLPELDT